MSYPLGSSQSPKGQLSMFSAAARQSLAETHLEESWSNKMLGFAVLAIAGTIVMAIAAKIQVPFFPVPMTLQTLAVFLISAAFGRNLAVATMVLYIIEGLFGLPVFAGFEAGPAYMAGPTAGYLAGFVVAAFVIGSSADMGWSRNVLKIGGAMVLGAALIFALGFAWLSTLIGAEKAFQFGVVPFALADLVKIAIAALVVSGIWKVWKKA